MKNTMISILKSNKVLGLRFSTIQFFTLIFLALSTINLCAQQAKAEVSAEELAKKLSNPVSNLISVPFQNNSDFGIGENEGSRNTLNIQPVIPLSLSDKVNLIIRWVQPVIAQYNITGAGEHQSGLSDAVVSAFFSPAVVKKGLIWGLGPVFLVPDGTNEFLTGKKFGTGVTGVILTQSKGLSFGALVNQFWSVAGSDERPDINQFYLQPFVSYTFKTGAGIACNLEMTQNWEANTTTLWFNPTVNGVIVLGKQKAQLVFGPRFNLVAPEANKADWGVRCGITFLFPK